jgi:hypothetical protein
VDGGRLPRRTLQLVSEEARVADLGQNHTTGIGRRRSCLSFALSERPRDSMSARVGGSSELEAGWQSAGPIPGRFGRRPTKAGS